MKQWKSLSGTTALLLVLTSAAQADVTAAEVWASWKAAAEGMGQVITPGSETLDGGTLTLRDVVMSMDAPEFTMTGNLGMIELRDQPGGTVAITVSPSYAMQMTITPEDDETVNLTMRVDQPDLKMTASGGDGTVIYDFTAPTLAISVTDLKVDGEEIEMVFDMTGSGVSGKYELTEGETTNVAAMTNVGLLTVKANVSEPGGSGAFALNADFADFALASDGSLMMLGAMQDMPAMLAAGFSTSGEFNHGAATYDIDFQDGSDTFQMAGKSDSGMLAVSFDKDAMSYEAGNEGFSFTMSGSEIPLPEIAAGFEEIAFGFLMPLSQSDTPQDYSFDLVLAGLTVSDMIWGLADPTAALPHDPATLIVNLAGQANWLIDIMDTEAVDAMDGPMPGEIISLDINTRVSVVGAELTGEGGFTFDNSDLETFDGLPAPTGEIDLTLVGANTLLDKLVAMGLLPEDQAMGARMMMGLFARPGGGEDTLTSKIEVKGDGSISANGQRLQ